MRSNEVAQLVTIVTTQDADGYDIQKEAYRAVYIGRKSVTRAEFYTGLQAGVGLSAVFILRCCDYRGEPMIKVSGRLYKIVRTYTADGEWLELICSDKAV